ncbi:hypothetical protein K525DRAFT_277414 [Schizophyllum commune Loenen D]|nr:hypothetical protein K525DRAFT_277414 [Schizophyllum commune Loenen D]
MPPTSTAPDERQRTTAILIPQKFTKALDVYRKLYTVDPTTAGIALWTNLLEVARSYLTAEGTLPNKYLESEFLAGSVLGRTQERERWENAGHVYGRSCADYADFESGFEQGFEDGWSRGKEAGMETCAALSNVMRIYDIGESVLAPRVDAAVDCSSTSTANTAVQTQPVTTDAQSSEAPLLIHPVYTEVATQVSPPATVVSAAPLAESLDWAAEADVHLPVVTTVSPSLPRPPPPRDLSSLSSGNTAPFASLSRRRRRGGQSRPRPRPRRAGTPYRREPRLPREDDISSLDWRSDPRLQDLSRALHALGWVRRGLS